MREINKIAESLFEKIRDRFDDVSLGDENAKATSKPENARFFNFDYVVDGDNHGNVTISIIDELSLKIYFSKNISHALAHEDRDKWYSFLRELREFAKRNLLSFEPRDITRSTLSHRDVQQQSKADNTYNKDEVIGESRMYGTTKSSYENDGDVKIILRHSENVDPEQRGARARKIKSIFIQNHEGERFKLPENNLKYARAMARHVSEGGSLTDDFGRHITEIAQECSKLRPFRSNMIRRTFEDQETQAMVEAAFEYHGLLNNTLKKIGGRKGYAQCKEQFVATSTSYIPEADLDVDALRERFVKRSFNDRLEDALPLVHKAYNMKKQNKFAQQFESWANNVAEGWDDDEEGVKQWGIEPINVDDLSDLFADPLPLGVDGANATTAIEYIIQNDELADQLVHAGQQNPEADARDIIIAWLQENVPAVYQELINELGTDDTYGSADGGMDGQVSEDSYDEDQVESIQSAIIRRILGNISQHSALIRKAGPEGVMNAAHDVASFHAPVEELGTSDISNMVREVYNEVGVEYPEVEEAYTPREEKPITYKKESPSKKKSLAKHYDYLAKTLGEEVDEGIGQDYVNKDYVNKDEKLKRIGAKELSIKDKLKIMPSQAKAMVKGDSEDDLVHYNKMKSGLEEMRKLAGLK